MSDIRAHTPITDDIVVGPEEIEPPPAASPPVPNVIDATAAADVAPAIGSVPPPPVKPPAPPPAEKQASIAALRRDRRDLFDQREESVYHVGGLAVDLRRRGVEDADLLARRSDLVLEMDMKLAELDRHLIDLDVRRKQKAPPTVGYCMSCGAPFPEEAAFCFRCGARVLPPDPPEAGDPAEVADTPTTVIDLAEEGQ